jgi:valyl-tRNA synthetase
MDKIYDQAKTEKKWYQFWEESGFFKPEVNPKGKPFTIILPPPNANAPLHFGHAMYTLEDILIRYHRMRGDAALWVPGSDHAGFETQVVFEKNLQKIGKSRFDFDRETLYQMIFDYVQSNKSGMEDQLRRLGYSLDWSREKFTLDTDVISIVYKTFKKMFDDGLIYRDKKLINFCTKHGTGFSDLEVLYEDRLDKLYFIKFPIVEGDFITIATTRPETMLGDVAVMVNPKDKRYQDIISKEVQLPISNRIVPIIADEYVDMEFGTGAVKVTPAHDMNDFEIAKKHNLAFPPIIGFDGRLTKDAGKYSGMKITEARAAVVEELQSLGLVEKIEDYTHRVGVCYKCGTVIEPLPLEQWFINVQDLKNQAIEIVKKGQIKIYPKNFESHYFQWLENLHDWNISRQIVWGIRIPAWYCKSCDKWLVTDGETLKKCPNCDSTSLEQDPDVFDTWFSSGQWPYITLMTNKPGDFEKFYPTEVMETGYDILKAWVSRMVMMGLYVTDKIPFENILLHGLVLDPLGKKMSKSKGNVVSPMEVVGQYGADAARLALVYGTATGHDQSLSYPKLDAMRKFTNKLWNIGRFIIEFAPEDAKHLAPSSVIPMKGDSPVDYRPMGIHTNKADQQILKHLKETTQKVTKALDTYRFHDGADALYEFIWHQFADIYIESTKDRRAQAQPVLEYVFRTSLELLHPFMPFISEELWQKLPHQGKSIMITKWPVVSK